MYMRVMRPQARSRLRLEVWLRSRVWLAALLLSAGWMGTGWSAAQTGQNQTAQSQSAQNQPTQNQPVQAASPTSGPARDAATPTDALISALRRSLVQEARGEALLELVFPPSNTPVRRARALPRLGAVPALIRRNFVVTATPDTVAGRPATRYLLTPTSVQAARRTIWIDVRWKVPLAYQERLPEGTLARRAELLSVNPGLSRLTARTVQTPAPGLKKALLSVLPGLSLPAGFEPLRVRVRAGAAAPGPKAGFGSRSGCCRSAHRRRPGSASALPSGSGCSRWLREIPLPSRTRWRSSCSHRCRSSHSGLLRNWRMASRSSGSSSLASRRHDCADGGLTLEDR